MNGTARVAAADRTAQLPRARTRRVRTPLETIAVTLATREAADHSGWRERLAAIGEHPSRVLRFASWCRGTNVSRLQLGARLPGCAPSVRPWGHRGHYVVGHPEARRLT